MSLLRILYGLYAWLAFVVIIFGITGPALILAPTLALRRQIGRNGVKALMWAVGTPLQFADFDRLPDGPCVVVANHASYIDGILLTAVLPPRYSFVVQHGAASWPYIGLIIKRMGVVFVTRDNYPRLATEMLQLLRRVRGGESLAVFPEGTFEATPGLLPFKEGAFFLAAHAGQPVVPVIIEGTRHLFPERGILPRPTRIRLHCLDPVRPGGTGRAEIRAFAGRCRRIMAAAYSEPDLLAEPDDMTEDGCRSG